MSRRGSYTTILELNSSANDSFSEGPLVLNLRRDYEERHLQGRQSPIHIHSDKAKFDRKLCDFPLSITYPSRVPGSSVFLNDGHTWKLNVSNEEYYIQGGPLKDHYMLEQIHAHWGSSDAYGSEHLVDGQNFAGEMHFVHLNKTKYGNCSKALNHGDGLAVIGVFFKIGEPHPELQKLTDLIKCVEHAQCKTSVEQLQLDMNQLLPKDVSQYWTYPGSLTTAPYSECVIWIVLKEAIEVSKEQIATMRSLLTYSENECCAHQDGHHGNVRYNHRPVQAGNRQQVAASFKPTNRTSLKPMNADFSEIPIPRQVLILKHDPNEAEAESGPEANTQL